MTNEIKLTSSQKRLLNAMEFDKWYDAVLDNLPRVSGKVYQALIRKGLLESQKVEIFESRTYTPMIWTHKFRKVRILEDKPLDIKDQE